MWLTATHCLSSTVPRLRLDQFDACSSGSPALPLIQCRPRSSEYDRAMFEFGCRFTQYALNGSVTWYTRPFVSNATFGSVLFVQLGGMSCVPVEMQSYPCTWLVPAGVPFGMVYEPRWKS